MHYRLAKDRRHIVPKARPNGRPRNQDRPVESLSGARGDILAAPEHFHGAPLGKKFLIFFKIVHSGVFYISGGRRGPRTSGGRGSFHPYPTLSTGLNQEVSRKQTWIGVFELDVFGESPGSDGTTRVGRHRRWWIARGLTNRPRLVGHVADSARSSG